MQDKTNKGFAPKRLLMAVTPYKGANTNHDADQMFWMLFGLQRQEGADVQFRRVFSFSLFNVYELDHSICGLPVQEEISTIFTEFGLFKDAVHIASLALTEIVGSDEGRMIWDTEIPTPSEVVEVYFNNKMFIFCDLEFRANEVAMHGVQDWTLQIKSSHLSCNAAQMQKAWCMFIRSNQD